MPASLLTAGSVYKFRLTATKDGGVWDLTGAAVTLYLHAPGVAAVAKVATVDNGPGGIASFVCATTDLTALSGSIERWTRTWEVVVGGVTEFSLPISFSVVPVP